jgi:hypothetical protein
MEERCVCCGEILDVEGRQVCWKCEHSALKTGKILQSNKASSEDIEQAYEFLYWKG